MSLPQVPSRRLAIAPCSPFDPRSARLNSEMALVFESRQLAEELVGLFYFHDLEFSRQITGAEAAEFENPSDVKIRFEQSIGKYFEDEM